MVGPGGGNIFCTVQYFNQWRDVQSSRKFEITSNGQQLSKLIKPYSNMINNTWLFLMEIRTKCRQITKSFAWTEETHVVPSARGWWCHSLTFDYVIYPKSNFLCDVQNLCNIMLPRQAILVHENTPQGRWVPIVLQILLSFLYSTISSLAGLVPLTVQRQPDCTSHCP